MLLIPLQATPSQTLTVQLADQPCRLHIAQRSTGLFLDLYVNDALLLGSVICLDRVRIVRSSYLGFIGDFAFEDTEGFSDPTYDGLGGRYRLLYLEAADL